VTQKERELGQRLEADVEIAYAREVKRRRPDTIDSFVDYEELSRVVRGQIAMARCRLLETLAEELALALLAEFDPPRVRVRLRKMHVPVADFSGLPEVEVERVR
jgi:dihydroneopterin aldolase